MGYHISLINTTKCDDKDKALYNFDILKNILINQFSLQEQLDNKGQFSFFYSPEDENIVLFYKNNELWANTTDDNVIAILLAISSVLKDGTRVRGDNLETFKSVSETYIHEDDKLIYFIENNKVSKLKEIFYRYGGFVIPILFGLLTWIYHIL